MHDGHGESAHEKRVRCHRMTTKHHQQKIYHAFFQCPHEKAAVFDNYSDNKIKLILDGEEQTGTHWKCWVPRNQNGLPPELKGEEYIYGCLKNL